MTLDQARKRAGLTQDQLAERSGVDQTTISKIETGERTPRYETIVALEDALKLTAGTLLFGSRACEVTK